MKHFLFTIIILFSINVLRAQDRISYGPRAGVSIMQVSKSETLGRNFQLGINGGGYFDYNLNHWFSVRAELNYALRRQTAQTFDTVSIIEALAPLFEIDPSTLPIPDGINLNIYSNTKSRITMHSIELPMLGVLHLKNVKISAGPYIGVLVAAKTNSELKQDIPVLSLVDIDALADLLGEQGQFLPFLIDQLFPGYSEPETDEVRGASGLNRLDVGIVTDVTYQLDNNFSFGVRYQRGFLDYRSTTVGDKVVNNSLQFHIGYRFGKAKNEGPIIRVRKNTGED